MIDYPENYERRARLTNEDLNLRPKKFVFQVYPENISYVESLSYQEKQDLINQLITDYRENQYYEAESYVENGKLKKIIILVASIVIGVPLILFLINMSLDMTKSNYHEMQKNFEVLFY